jgi:transposase, IS30 family
MQSYNHFTLEERERLWELKKEGNSLRAISRKLGRNVSSISREIKRNSNKNKTYHPWRACIQYILRRRKCRRRYRLTIDENLNKWVTEGLSKCWPPETIAAVWNLDLEHTTVSHSTIYAALYQKRLSGYNPKTHLRRRGRRRNSHNSATIKPEHSIHDRPKIVDERGRIGDWEGDTIYGSPGKGLLVTCVDRKSRYLSAALLASREKTETANTMIEALNSFQVESITLDNGSEFADFRRVESELKTTVYFADPHAPWQRPTNEYTNGMLRYFFPKGTDFLKVSAQEVKDVLSLINNRPRKCLGWLSPEEIMFSKCCT